MLLLVVPDARRLAGNVSALPLFNFSVSFKKKKHYSASESENAARSFVLASEATARKKTHLVTKQTNKKNTKKLCFARV